MSTAAPSVALDTHEHYGPREFKALIERNTKRAYTVTMILLLIFAIYNFARPVLEAWFFPRPNIVKVKLTRVSLDALPPPPTNNEEAPPPPPPATPPPSGPAARAGSPVAVPEALLAEDLKDFANVDEINRASAVGGEGEDFGGYSPNIGTEVNITQREADPDLDEFIAVEKDPGFDYEALQRRVKYPEIARRNGIEGQVVVAALVGKDGKAEKTQIIDSDNEVLNKAAEAAVKETVFTPAIQNGTPVRVWVRIPISFRLR